MSTKFSHFSNGIMGRRNKSGDDKLGNNEQRLAAIRPDQILSRQFQMPDHLIDGALPVPLA